MARGRFITVEGGEGAGKSTQIVLLAGALEDAGHTVVRTREPGGTPLAEDIRSLVLARREEPVAPLSELLLLFAARAQHVDAVIEPALARGDWVVCDRFSDASHAYQGAGRGMDPDTIRVIDAFACGGLVPDLTLLFDLPVEHGLARSSSRSALDRFELEKLEFHERVRQAYLARARDEPQRIRVIDASRSRAQVTEDALAAIHAFHSAAAHGR